MSIGHAGCRATIVAPAARGRFPRLAIDFQPRRFDGSFGGNDTPWRRPNFTALAKEVLRADASRSFRLESAVLAFVTIVSAWPIAVMIHEEPIRA